MAIELTDLRTAVQVYLNTKVQVSVSAPVAAVPNTISPGEGFKFKVTANNAASADGGMSLKHVRYHLRVANPAIGKLIVPPATIGVARATASLTDPSLAAGTAVNEMFLSPVGEKHRLGTGETETIGGLKGKAGNTLGTTDIKLDILADPDLDFLFPKNENSVTASQQLKVD